MKASLLMTLVLVFGLSHLSQKPVQQARLAHARPGLARMGDVLAEMSIDETHELASSRLRTTCTAHSINEAIKQACSMTALSCDQHFATGVSSLIDNMETQAASRSRPRLTNCAESVAINSSTIELLASVSACS
jgi:hypothetical protein